MLQVESSRLFTILVALVFIAVQSECTDSALTSPVYEVRWENYLQDRIQRHYFAAGNTVGVITAAVTETAGRKPQRFLVEKNPADDKLFALRAQPGTSYLTLLKKKPPFNTAFEVAMVSNPKNFNSPQWSHAKWQNWYVDQTQDSPRRLYFEGLGIGDFQAYGLGHLASHSPNELLHDLAKIDGSTAELYYRYNASGGVSDTLSTIKITLNEVKP